MATAVSPTNGKNEKEGNKKKLTKVVSTKLSIEDDKALQPCAMKR